MDTVSTPNRPSGLPRPSRLPVLNKKSSRLFPSADSSEKPASVATRNSAVTAPPRLQKPASGSLSGRAKAPISRLSRDVSSTTSRHFSNGSKSSTGSTAPFSRPSSRINHQNIRPNAGRPHRAEDEENEQLTSLDSFRSVSSQEASIDDDQDQQGSPHSPNDVLPSIERKHSRPSLSDRAIGSLQSIPSTPKDRRTSNFFAPPESPMGPPPRPISAMSRDGVRSSSRPGTSDGIFPRPSSRASSPLKKGHASAKPANRTSIGGFGLTPKAVSRRSVSAAVSTRAVEERSAINGGPRSSSPPKLSAKAPNGLQAERKVGVSKTVASRPTKPRPALSKASASANKPAVAPVASPMLSESKPAKRTVSGSPHVGSSALREQIAAAKIAARREKEKAMHDSPVASVSGDATSSESTLYADPFNQAPRDEKHILRNRINTARMDGRLNISAMKLQHIPTEVMTMFETSAMEESKVNWAEVVDLTRLIVADNELEVITDDVFPDATVEEMLADEDTPGNQFGGLEMLDLHGNALLSLPIGLRRLERLTSLNLAHNKLENQALDIVAQIPTLRDVKLGHNALSGNLPATMCGLTHLEILDLQANRLLGLPEALRELVNLRVLNVAGNQLTALPMEAIQQLSLTDLDASNNALIGSLFPLGGESVHRTLRTLNVSNNSLAALTFSPGLELPQLRELRVANNHMTSLPPISTWSELTTLIASDNKIEELPVGFTGLKKLRNVNLTSNEMRVLDPEIGRMDSLESLILAANPLREKKFLSMSAADIRRDLKSRLVSEDIEDDPPTEDEFVDASDSFSSKGNPNGAWPMKPNGVLNLAAKNLSDDVNDTLGSFLQTTEVKHLILQANRLTAVPPALWLCQDLKILDLSGNVLGSDYFSDELKLPVLKELNLSNCRLSTLDPLVSQLSAPSLQSLNVSTNRLVGPLPTLRVTYPALTSLWAADNRFLSITADALRGLTTVSLASNDIESLPAEIGLLWDQGLHNFDIGSNAFRVPNYRLLEKGTEATLRWLRDRIPAGHEEQMRIERDLD